MVLNWSNPENIIMLCRLIASHGKVHITVDLDLIAQEWPGDEKPSAVALEGQLRRYREHLAPSNFIKMTRKKRARAATTTAAATAASESSSSQAEAPESSKASDSSNTTTSASS